MENFKPILLAVLVGSISALFLFKEVEVRTEPQEEGNVVAVQIGVFRDEASANKLKDLHGGQVFLDEGLYRVYYSILNRGDNIDFITDYLERQGVNYYLKKLTLDEKIVEQSTSYEKKMSNSNDKEKLDVNEELLDYYKEVV